MHQSITFKTSITNVFFFQMLQASPQQKDINQTIEKILNFYFVTHSIRNKFTKKYTKKKMDKQKEKKLQKIGMMTTMCVYICFYKILC